jgi:hypothetical protein
MIGEPRHREGLDEEMVKALRAMTGAERLRVASGMFSAARRMLASHLETRHSDWSAEAVRKEVARRLSLGAG